MRIDVGSPPDGGGQNGMSTGSLQEQAQAHVAEVARALNERLGEITRLMRDLLSTRIDELRGDARLVDLLGASIEGNIDNILHSLQYGITVDRMEPPSAAIEYARRLAQRGVPLNALVRAYRLGQQNLLEACFAESAAREVPPEVRVLAHEHFVSHTFNYIDSISQQVVTVYEKEREQWLADRNTLRTAALQELVEGKVRDVAAAEAALGYRLNGATHLGLILWSDEGGDVVDHLKTFDTVVGALSRSFGAGRAGLLLARDATSAWAWIALAEPAVPSIADLRACLEVLPAAPLLAVGGAHSGAHGFRQSHLEAEQAQRVASAAGTARSSITLYDAPGLSLAALVCANVDEARAWVRATLGPLAADDEQHARLRETLRVLLEHGGSYTSAADELCMHRNTVRYRITRAEAELGRPITANRQATDVALTLCRWLGPAVLTPG
ncbi:MAG: PucR family transcriptional regulator [Mycobacteriales bacterium]